MVAVVEMSARDVGACISSDLMMKNSAMMVLPPLVGAEKMKLEGRYVWGSGYTRESKSDCQG